MTQSENNPVWQDSESDWSQIQPDSTRSSADADKPMLCI